jgi:succinate dehydrogenase / fumarate reductase cytochrome b subunit
MADIRDALMVGRTSGGRLVRRPLSPHLQVYRPQISSMLSIAHRATGIVLAFGLILLVWWLAAAAGGDRAYAGVSWFLTSWLGVLALLVWTAALWYHFCAGIRHLAWDAGYGFGLTEYRRTGMAVLAASAILTVLTWLIGVISL